MRIGVIDLDTSHPKNWIPIERALGHEVVGVWDSGVVHPAGYAEAFAREMSIPRVFGSPSEMLGEVDGVIIHGCDWDTHVEKARPFVEAGLSVLIDKPMAGNLRDLNQLRAWAKSGARIAGGSSLRFSTEAREWLARPANERGMPHTVICGCAVDEFNYGIHAYAQLCALMGTGIYSVQYLGEGVQKHVRVNWSDGRMGLLTIGAAASWLPFYACVVTDRSVFQYQADNNKLYRALLEATLPYLARATDQPPLPMDQLLEPELCALAARQSWFGGGQETALADLRDADTGYDGHTFAVGYRATRYPASARG